MCSWQRVDLHIPYERNSRVGCVKSRRPFPSSRCDCALRSEHQPTLSATSTCVQLLGAYHARSAEKRLGRC